MNTDQKKRQIKAALDAQEFYLEINKWPRKLTFYNREGNPLPNMPADPWSMERCLKKGFTLTPPNQPVSKPITIKSTVQPSNGEKQPEKSDAALGVADEAIKNYGQYLASYPTVNQIKEQETVVKDIEVQKAEAKAKRKARAERKAKKLTKTMAGSKN